MEEVVRFALLGLGVGAMYTLAAQGLILIYRGSGVLNFAHGAIGVLGAFLAWELRDEHGMPFGAAFPLGVGACALIGALVHVLVMRPLRTASPLARIVATLGILITIQSAVVLRYGPTVTFVQPALPQARWRLWGDVVVSADRIVLLAIAAALSAALWALYRYTRFGLATSAVAENQRAAAALGWSPDTIAAANWALGSALAGAAAILVSPIVALQAGAMTNLVLAAMAAALVAGFRSFPIAFAAGMSIAIVQTEIARFWPLQTGADKAVPFVVIVLYLVLTGRALPLRNHFLQRLPSVGSGRIRPALVGAAAAVAALLVWTVSPTWVDALVVTFSVGLVLLSGVVLTGYTGQLSLAQYAIAGVGAFIAGRLVATQGWPFWAALLVGVLGTVPVGLAFALPAVRVRGINLAIVTLGLGTAIELVVFNNASWTGSFMGTDVGSPTLLGWSIDPISHQRRYATVCLVAFVLASLVAASVRRGRVGRRLLAVRTNERAAAALGINVPAAKLYAFGLSAGIAALGGILIGFHAQSISYGETYTTFASVTSIGLAFVGGIGYLAGPLLGSTLAPGGIGAAIGNAFLSDVADWLPLIGGVSLLAIVLSNQDGIARETIRQLGWLRRRLGFAAAAPVHQRVPAARTNERMRVPARTLEIDGLTVRYRSVTAVDELSLTVRPSQVVGLIGPNGAGKTSAIDGITGFTKPASAAIWLDGERIDRWPVAKRARAGISRSFQSLELFEDATVLDNLRVASDPRDVASYLRDLVFPAASPLPVEVDAAIEEFGFREALHRDIGELSYGQRRLLAIARAVAARPSVLLLDEPAAGLSELESRALAHLVRRLAVEWGMAILLVEHDMSFVMSVCDELVVLDFGRTISRGQPDRVRTDPAVVAAYLGEPEQPAAADEPQIVVPVSSRRHFETGSESPRSHERRPS